MFGNLKRSLLKFVVRCELSSLRLLSAKFRYQPAPRGLTLFGSRINATRECEDRLAIIRNHLPASSRNVIDLGSNTGYYLFRLAEFGYLCHGLEADTDLVHFTCLAMHFLETKSVSSEWGNLDLTFVQHMPRYDVVLCLSIMHHIIMSEGIDAAEAVLKGLVQKTNHVMFFEMGQSNETKADWFYRLPRMEPDPEVWISQWLKKCGFKRVETIGTSQTTVPRYLFAAYP